MCSKEEQPETIEAASAIPRQPVQEQPGLQHELKPQPLVHHLPTETDSTLHPYKAAGKLEGKIALITGGDSGIGRSVATLFSLEGCKGIGIVHLEKEYEDAQETKRRIESQSQTKVVLISKDVGFEKNAIDIVNAVVQEFGRIDILVNNSSEQHIASDIEKITAQQLERTFRTNIFGMFYLAKHAVKHMNKGSNIINTTSVTAYNGSRHLVDYASTKGAIVAFTRSLALNLVSRGIRVNAVAPGPIWTPLITASFPEDKMETFGKKVPMGRAGHPSEVAPCYVFLASNDSSYMTGQVLHPNGGSIING
ncbi:7450_t:CDS:2 [Paraglomus brasilianum]|uniref:7450_t:CDS:1 n=1 Tax=Paraglomus brasilianum TaxID=144538 RepID=A0A9N9C348_9GLOM|nr:7450_t:CDS:2 [Paraglomus brasilianum]